MIQRSTETFMRFCVHMSKPCEIRKSHELGSLLPVRKHGTRSPLGPVLSRTHIDLLFETFLHLLQLQLVLAAQLSLVPMLFFLEQPKLTELLAPEG